MQGVPEVLDLIDKKNSPFLDSPPTYIRALIYDYAFTSPKHDVKDERDVEDEEELDADEDEDVDSGENYWKRTVRVSVNRTYSFMPNLRFSFCVG